MGVDHLLGGFEGVGVGVRRVGIVDAWLDSFMSMCIEVD